MDQGGETYVEVTIPEVIEEIIKVTRDHLGMEVSSIQCQKPQAELLIKNEGQTIDEIEHRSIVGKIFYPTSKMMIEGCNASKELARHFTGPKEEHWKAIQICGIPQGEHQDNRQETKRTEDCWKC